MFTLVLLNLCRNEKLYLRALQELVAATAEPQVTFEDSQNLGEVSKYWEWEMACFVCVCVCVFKDRKNVDSTQYSAVRLLLFFGY